MPQATPLERSWLRILRSARKVRLKQSELKAIVRADEAVRLLDLCKVDRDCVGVLFIDGRYVDQVEPGLYAKDIQPGDYVTVLNEIVELPSFLWCCSGSTLPMDEPVRTRYIPREAGLPCRVVTVCLPFVYAKRPYGKLTTFDTRQQQLVRLDPSRGRKVWKEMKAVMKSRME